MANTHLEIKDPEVVKAIADPKRLQILHLLGKKQLSARQLGKMIGEPTRNLYYHLNELEKHDIIEVVEVKQKGNLLEKFYQTKYTYLSLDPTLLMFGEEKNKLLYTTIASGFQHSLATLQTAFNKQTFFESKKLGASLSIKMTETVFSEFIDKMSALIKEFFDDGANEGELDVTFSTLCFGTSQKNQEIDDTDEV